MADMIRTFEELTPEQQSSAGGKGSALARLYQAGYPVPDGLVVLPAAFDGDEMLPEAWAQVADAIADRWQARIVITGGRDELDLAWSVYARMYSDAIVAAGDTTLGQLAALFERCRLVMGPDCGPLHLALATGTPTVHLHGPVDPRKFGPWGDPEKHLVLTSDRECIPCNRLDYSFQELPSHPCVREITTEAVLGAADRLLE